MTALLMNKFVLQPGIDCCLFYVGDIIYKRLQINGKKPCYIRFFFFKRTVDVHAYGLHVFAVLAATDFISQND